MPHILISWLNNCKLTIIGMQHSYLWLIFFPYFLHFCYFRTEVFYCVQGHFMLFLFFTNSTSFMVVELNGRDSYKKRSRKPYKSTKNLFFVMIKSVIFNCQTLINQKKVRHSAVLRIWTTVLISPLSFEIQDKHHLFFLQGRLQGTVCSHLQSILNSLDGKSYRMWF